MAGVIFNQGLDLVQDMLVNNGTPESLELVLFSSNTTPTNAHTEADYTEADFTGYAHIDLTPASWVMSGTTTRTATYPQQTFTSSAGSQDKYCYGYGIRQTTSGMWIGAELFSDGPYHIVNNLDDIKVTPVLTAASA